MKNITEFILEAKTKATDYPGYKCEGFKPIKDADIEPIVNALKESMPSYIGDVNCDNGKINIKFTKGTYRTIRKKLQDAINAYNANPIQKDGKYLLINRLSGDIDDIYHRNPDASMYLKDSEEGAYLYVYTYKKIS